MPLLFSYGTLQQPAVQMSTFGRLLQGHPDELIGFERAVQPLDDPKFAATNAEQMMDKGTFPRSMPDVLTQLQKQDADAAARELERAAALGRRGRNRETLFALAQLSLLAAEAGDWISAADSPS